MPVGIASFNGKRLTQARNVRGLSAINLSDMVSLSQATISLYENGNQKPKQETLDRLASVLNVPVNFFLNDITITKPSKLFYRSMSAATKTSRTRAEARYEWAIEVIDYLLEFFDFPESNLPEFDIPEDFRALDTNTIEMLAEQLRQHWTLGDGPVTNMIRTIESNGIITWRTYFEAETLDAFSEKRLPHSIIVLSSDKENYFRSRFDAAHELAHIVLHSNVDRTTLNTSADFQKIENQAHLFAGAFLLPAIAYSMDLWSISIDAFRSLKPRWNVSIGMQIMRCYQLGLIDEDQKKRLWINLSRRGWRKNEPLDDSTPTEKPNLINEGFMMLVDEGVKTREQLVQDLCLSASDIEKISELPEGYISGKTTDAKPILKTQSKNVVPFRR